MTIIVNKLLYFEYLYIYVHELKSRYFNIFIRTPTWSIDVGRYYKSQNNITSRTTSSMPSFEYESILRLGFASVSEYQAFDMKSHLMTSSDLRGLYLFKPGGKPAAKKKKRDNIKYIIYKTYINWSQYGQKCVAFTQ